MQYISLEPIYGHYLNQNYDLVVSFDRLIQDNFEYSALAWTILGASYLNLGIFDRAIQSFQRSIECEPDNPASYNNLGAAYRQIGKLDFAISAFKNSLSLSPDYADAYYNIAGAYNDKGLTDLAISSYESAIRYDPNHKLAHVNLGSILLESGDIDRSILLYKKAIAVDANYAEGYYNLGLALDRLGQVAEAIKAFRRAIELKKDYAEAHDNLGLALSKEGNLEEAIASHRLALKFNPYYTKAYNNLGVMLQHHGEFEEAISCYRQAIDRMPDYADAHANLGAAFQCLNRYEESLASLKRSIEIKPDFSDAYYKQAIALTYLGRLEEAIVAFRQSLEISPDSPEVLNDLGIALIRQGNAKEAITCWQHAVKLRPEFAEAYNNLGNAFQGLGRLDEAISIYQQALIINPDFVEAEAQMRHQQQQICDWRLSDQLANICARLVAHNRAVASFAMLPMVDDAKLQYRFSRKWAEQNFREKPLPLPSRNKVSPERLRIGYFSADFCEHPVSALVTGLLRSHDRSQFEVHAYGYGRAKHDEWRARVQGSVDMFVDVTQFTDAKIVDLARGHGLDVAIDLTGYTTHSRSDVFQYRLAPVQINYLGYPGTMAADFIDYIIADPTIIPTDQRPFYSERVIYLPHSYQPNDETREIADTQMTRTDFGLPEHGFVFCCFNNTYKIGPREFDIWMRLLGRVEGSILWLLKVNQWAESNLRKEATARGIDPSRIIFAERISPLGMHLARQRHADLFLDTFNYNAHTTASDALWAGMPVVTKIGRQFAARVAASLLNAVGLPELITKTESDYEALAFELATNPAKLAEIRAKLAANRLAEPLFDTRRYTRNFEAGLQQAFEIFRSGKPPEDIWVT